VLAIGDVLGAEQMQYMGSKFRPKFRDLTFLKKVFFIFLEEGNFIPTSV
jgi:hypothetical protein